MLVVFVEFRDLNTEMNNRDEIFRNGNILDNIAFEPGFPSYSKTRTSEMLQFMGFTGYASLEIQNYKFRHNLFLSLVANLLFSKQLHFSKLVILRKS